MSDAMSIPRAYVKTPPPPCKEAAYSKITLIRYICRTGDWGLMCHVHTDKECPKRQGLNHGN